MDDIVDGQGRRRRPYCILERSGISSILILLETKCVGRIPDPFTILWKRRGRRRNVALEGIFQRAPVKVERRRGKIMRHG